MTDNLQKIEANAAFTPCGCMGQMYGEPYCLCEMQRRGLKLNEEARAAEHARAKEQWAKLMESGKLFATETHNAKVSLGAEAPEEADHGATSARPLG